MEIVVETKQKPAWLKIRPPTTEHFSELKQLVQKSSIATVCQESHCPNISECWSQKTLTFMIMGDTCTRACKFCNIKTKFPAQKLNPDEPTTLAKALQKLKINYAVITTVARDDLPDQGASHFAKCIQEIKKYNPNLIIEILAQDFKGNLQHVETLAKTQPHVYAHNIETVKRLQHPTRDPRANYEQSLKVLQHVKTLYPNMITKSSIMVGLGETEEEVIQTMKDLLTQGVEILTLGQYLQPNKRLLQVKEYVRPEQFKKYEKIGLSLGFKAVSSGPFVRSSYKAHETYITKLLREKA